MRAIEQGRVVRNHRCRCEVWATNREVSNRAPYYGDWSIGTSDISLAQEYTLNVVDRIRERLASENKVIDCVEVRSMPLLDFHVSPDDIICYDNRFGCTTRVSTDVDARLDEFIEYIAPQFTELKRMPYRNFAIALLFRIFLAYELGILPVKDEGEEEQD